MIRFFDIIGMKVTTSGIKSLTVLGLSVVVFLDDCLFLAPADSVE
jgi:hypothetical protein